MTSWQYKPNISFDVREKSSKLAVKYSIDYEGHPYVMYITIKGYAEVKYKKLDPTVFNAEDLYFPMIPLSYTGTIKPDLLDLEYRAVRKKNEIVRPSVKKQIESFNKKNNDKPELEELIHGLPLAPLAPPLSPVIDEMSKTDYKSEWEEIFPTPKPKSFKDRIVDRIIRNIVWGV